MKFEPKEPPRRFEVGWSERFEIADCGRLELEPDEQITLTTPSGAEYDVTRKSWGFYASPSLNHRLSGFGLRAVLVRNVIGRYFVLLVERGHEGAFEDYVAIEQLVLVAWLDNDAALAALEEALQRG